MDYFDSANRSLLREGVVSVLKSSLSLRAFLFDDLLIFLQDTKNDKDRKYILHKKAISYFECQQRPLFDLLLIKVFVLLYDR